MKTVLFTFRRSALVWESGYIGRITRLFGAKGITFDEVRILSADDELSFLKQLGEAKDLFDCAVIADGEEVNFNVNDCISRHFRRRTHRKRDRQKIRGCVQSGQ